MNSSSLSYTKWKCQYHIVFIPKYIQEQQEEAKKEEMRR